MAGKFVKTGFALVGAETVVGVDLVGVPLLVALSDALGHPRKKSTDASAMARG
jgi:hypothetical protein